MQSNVREPNLIGVRGCEIEGSSLSSVAADSWRDRPGDSFHQISISTALRCLSPSQPRARYGEVGPNTCCRGHWAAHPHSLWSRTRSAPRDRRVLIWKRAPAMRGRITPCDPCSCFRLVAETFGRCVTKAAACHFSQYRARNAGSRDGVVTAIGLNRSLRRAVLSLW
jgi:hypothetical protein